MTQNVKIAKLAKSMAEIEASHDSAVLEEAYQSAIAMRGLSLEVSGFRKGHVPRDIVVEKIGTEALLREAADIVLNREFYKIAREQKLEVIGQPNITISKLALGNPFEWRAVFAVLPEFALADYKAIAKRENGKPEYTDFKPTVTDQEIDEAIQNIRKNKAYFDWFEAHKHKADFKKLTPPDFDKEENLPALDDTFATSTDRSGSTKTLSDLRERVRTNLAEDKKHKNIEKRKMAIIEALLKETKFEVPDILTNSEVERSLAQMKSEIEQYGMKFEDYLRETKKTEAELKKEFAPSAEKKARTQLVLNRIAEAEKLEPHPEIMAQQVKEMTVHYPTAKEENIRIYVATQLLNRAVLDLLDTQ